MWEDFHEAMASRPHRLLGRGLFPFCSYHHFWLKILNSPLLVGGEVSLVDIEVAVRICSCKFGQAERVIKPRWTDKWKILYYQFRYNIPDLCNQFAEYIQDYNSPPERAPTGGEVHSTSTAEPFPYQAWLVTGLMCVMGLTEEQAWMMPIGKAEWYLSISNAFRDKETGILGGHDREFIEGMKARKLQQEQNGNTSI
jgi:hypothetical protein